jgi:hypothetical protein
VFCRQPQQKLPTGSHILRRGRATQRANDHGLDPFVPAATLFHQGLGPLGSRRTKTSRTPSSKSTTNPRGAASSHSSGGLSWRPTPITAEWCNDSIPGVLAASARVTNPDHPNFTFHYHHTRGLLRVVSVITGQDIPWSEWPPNHRTYLPPPLAPTTAGTLITDPPIDTPTQLQPPIGHLGSSNDPFPP